ncbi:MAG: alpha-2-macroglobulin family protein [Fimbriimonadaceae bacterium]
MRTGPDIHVWVASNVAPSAKINLTVNSRNVPLVRLTAYAINAPDWLRRLANRGAKPPAPSGKPAARWNVRAMAAGGRPANANVDTYYSTTTRLPHLRPGVYEIVATGAKGYGPSAAVVVNVTNLEVLVKRSPSRVLVWVTDARRGRPVVGAQVALYDHDGNFQMAATTSDDGAALLHKLPGPSTIVVSHGRDFAGLDSMATNPNGRLVAHFETDRPIYRPGQTVFFKTILRRTQGQGYAVDASAACSVELRDPKDNPIDVVALASNSMASVHGRFRVPLEGMTGAYSLVLTTHGDRAYQTVTVAEYRKPQFKVEVNSAERRYLAGERGAFRVKATYYFGAPVQQAAVRYTIRWTPSPFAMVTGAPMWLHSGNGNLYPGDTYRFGGFIAENTAFTDNDGQLTIPFPTNSQGDATYTIDVTVSDQTRQQVTTRSTVPVYAASIRLGLQSEGGYAMLGGQIPIDINVRDLDARPAAAAVVLVLAKPEWDEKRRAMAEHTLSKWSVEVPKGGHMHLKMYAPVEGSLVLRATAAGGTGRTARAAINIFVASPYASMPPRTDQPQVTIRLDKTSYAPGDLIRAFITTNRTTPLLVTVEGGDVWRHKVWISPKAGQTFAFRATPAMSPNAYVSALQWIQNRLVGNDIEIPIPNPANLLHVEVMPDKSRYRPGDKGSFTVRTTNQSGAPVRAEVALSVVDESIYALSPDATNDIFGFFWGQREDQVITTMSAPIEMAGGAYQRVNTVAPLRQRFEDTAFWIADLMTDRSGIGTVSFEIPGNLTTWRATARGVTDATSVGAATADVVANRSTMLRLATPRQMVEGDRLRVIATVDNRTSEAHEYDISIKAQGVAIAGSPQTHIHVGAGKQGMAAWDVNANLLPPDGICVLVGQAIATDVEPADRANYSDAVETSFPIAPKGVRVETALSGALKPNGVTEVTLSLPRRRIEPASTVKLRVWQGLSASLKLSAAQVLRGGSWGALSAANQLQVAAATHMKPTDEAVREALAMLSRTQSAEGWGWWEGGTPDASITARVLSALVSAHASNLDANINLVREAQVAAIQRYNQTNLWEDRAQLAAALQDSEHDAIESRIAEVLRRAGHLSPYAKLRLAESMAKSNTVKARELADDALKDAVLGPDTAFVPTGAGVGWSATDTVTTAQALAALERIGARPNLQQKMARWLVEPSEGGSRSADDSTAIVHALAGYLGLHPESPSLGTVELTVNGVAVPTTTAKFDDAVFAEVPRALLKNTLNRITIRRLRSGAAFYTFDVTVYRPLSGRSGAAMRILRRFEVRNEAGIWTELRGPVHPGEPVRCTVVAWGDGIPDAVRVLEPIPAGFELVDDQSFPEGRSEVRDGAIIHYLVNSGNPVTFRYYLRSETEGVVTALPAVAEYRQRPRAHGQSEWQTVTVRAAP